MFVTDRGKSANHMHLEILGKRAALDGKEERELERYRSGYEGELEYDRVFDEVGHAPMYVFRDIWLGIDDSKVQLDAVHDRNQHQECDTGRAFDGDGHRL
ncbi:hypothetical protein WN59_09555 [Salinicoccus sediminis]|uniref:Uncharacterized protein n=1 Tax=Salinicoccus sediminis TaxID=1432562 RepID=A0A0M2SMN1_9STAP|nr:hypothetical protein [Salinicoccus sediminis]KKK33850.1 hypothetical protein WN59_09555 [Salinicoccus sediminis]